MKKIIPTISLLLASLSLANAQLFDFDFFGVSDTSNSEENQGVAVSGSVQVDVGAGSVKFTINNLSGTGSYPYADLTGFGFWNEPQGGGTPYTYSGFSHTDNATAYTSWANTNDISDLWQSGDSYYGAEANSPAGYQKNGLNGGSSAMFTFTGASADLTDLVNAWTNEGIVSNDKQLPTNQHDIRFRFQSVGGENVGGSEKLYLDLRPVPEPSTYGMIGASALVLLIVARRFKRK
jgi:hypothetical protein